MVLTFSQIITLIFGGNSMHLFAPADEDATPSDETYRWHIMVKQIALFGPLPESFPDILPFLEKDRWHDLDQATRRVLDGGVETRWMFAVDACLTKDDREFIGRVMKYDPRDRPTATQLLQDKWFDGVP